MSALAAYDVQRLLGKGAMGEVRLVRRRADGALLALKSVEFVSAKDRALATNEITILRKLSHPHVVRFEDSFVDKESVCIVMQYCEGGDLADLISTQRTAGKRLAEPESRGLLAQLASALAHMHSIKIVHRDIKSSNVFLLGGGPSGAFGASRYALLGDFGVAKALESTRAMACTQCGTPYYLPPEVCNGANYNTKADLWSFGVLAYEILALRYPFTADNLPALVMKIVSGKHAPLPSTISAELRGLVQSLLQQRPKDRLSADQVTQHPALQVATAPPAPRGASPASGAAAREPSPICKQPPSSSSSSTQQSAASKQQQPPPPPPPPPQQNLPPNAQQQKQRLK